MQFLGEVADNPDQRIAEDIRLFIEKVPHFGVGLLGAVVTLVSFIVICGPSRQCAPFTCSASMAVPGYLVWAALIYSIRHRNYPLDRSPAVPLNFIQQRYEADFRFNLVRVRENPSRSHCSTVRRPSANAAERFGRLVDNWMQIMIQQKRVTFFTAGYTRIPWCSPTSAVVLPISRAPSSSAD